MLCYAIWLSYADEYYDRLICFSCKFGAADAIGVICGKNDAVGSASVAWLRVGYLAILVAQISIKGTRNLKRGNFFVQHDISLHLPFGHTSFHCGGC